MANKRLSLQDIELMKSMVIKGISPEDIAKHFNIAISSVHNYKARFKQEGIKFPNVRGKRPTGSIDITSNKEVKSISSQKQILAENNKEISMESNMNLIVNGIEVKISSGAKKVNISKNSIEVNF